ncbi:MAG: mevalonate kinase [Anaerolineaceae bacterium]|jgi:mevalonate kinase|nr:mevalonate kinase [Anaerolineaceae bacterium]
MPATISTAPGKTILFGEHAVVYGQPAIAVPINERQAKVKIFPSIGSPTGDVQFIAPQVEFDKNYNEMDIHHPLRIAVDEVKKYLNISDYPACKVHMSSTISISAGLGSSAAISVALIKGLFNFVGYQPSQKEISDLAYLVEIEFHGTPSGIDNTVIAFNRPVYYQKNKEFEFIIPGGEFTIIIADSGVKGNTKEAVSAVRERWRNNPNQFEDYFKNIGEIVINAKAALETGNQAHLGKLMIANQDLLRKIGVSHPSLENLIEIAQNNGGQGAKLCGGGLGGNIIILTDKNKAETLSEVLLKNGASQAIIMTLTKDKYV